MFGEGTPLSSESPVSSALGVRSPGVLETGFRREVRVFARSVPVCGSGGHEHKGSFGSLIDAALEVVGAASTIIYSGGEDGEDWRARDFPFPKVVSRSGVWLLTGVRDLSGVRDRFGVLRTGD